MKIELNKAPAEADALFILSLSSSQKIYSTSHILRLKPINILLSFLKFAISFSL